MTAEQKSNRNDRRALGRSEVLCPHCHARNPASAYCCLNCFKVIRPDALPFWRRPISSGRVSAVIMAAIGFILITGAVQWFKEAEAHLTAMSENNRLYHQSTLEHRRRRAAAPAPVHETAAPESSAGPEDNPALTRLDRP